MSAPDRLWYPTGGIGKPPQFAMVGPDELKDDIEKLCKDGPAVCYIRKAALPVEELRECLDDRYGPETAALFKTEYRLLERILAVLEGNDE